MQNLIIKPDVKEETTTFITNEELGRRLLVGDIVFVHIDILPFRKIARDTGSWTNHVGIVIDISGKEPLLAESKFPFSCTTPLSKFIKRSRAGRVAVSRLKTPITAAQQIFIKEAALKRMGIFYDTGFNLYSKRQFCSRFVYEVVKETMGIHIGTIENLESLFKTNPDADLRFWRIWYFGNIPWTRETITPASALNSPEIYSIFDGYSAPLKARFSPRALFQATK